MSPASLVRLVALAALWGGSFLFMRIVVPAIGAVPTAFGRVALAALALAALVRWTVPAARRGFDGRFGATLAVGVLNSGLPFLCFAIAARSLPAGYSAILNATAPLAGVAIGAAFFGERAGSARLAGVAIGLAGVGVLVRAGPVEPSLAVWLGVVACLAATACYGLAGFLARRWIHERASLDSTVVAAGSQLGAVAFLLPCLVLAAALADPVSMPQAAFAPATVGALLALGIGCTALAYVLYFRLLADIGPVRTLSVTFLIPLFGVLWGALFLGEPLSWAHAAGGGSIAVAVVLVLRRQEPADGRAVPAR